MKVEVRTATHKDDYRDGLVITVDEVDHMSFFDGEPEDNTLTRNFNDVYGIPKLMQMAWEAGRREEPLDVERIPTTWDEL